MYISVSLCPQSSSQMMGGTMSSGSQGARGGLVHLINDSKTLTSHQICISVSLFPQSSSQMTGGTMSSGSQGVGGGQLESMLGDLQSDLGKQGISTKTKGLCAACNQPVVGQVLTFRLNQTQ